MLNKQALNINFAQGLDTKTDKYQVQPGKFLSLQNTIFDKGGLLQKRNGYAALTQLPNNSSTYLTTLNGNLTAVGETISAYSSGSGTWVTKGTMQTMEVSTLPLIRNSINQIQSDAAVSPNGLVCTVYTVTNAGTTSYLYAIADSTTGQNIINPSALPFLAGGAVSGSSRVFIVGNFFVVVSPTLISSTTFLQYFSIPINNPTAMSAAQNIFPEAYVPISSNPGWDGAVANDTLVIAYNTTAGGQAIHVTSLTAAQIASNSASSVNHSFTGATNKAGIVSVCVDITVNPNIFYISFWNPTTTNGYTCAVYTGFANITTQFSPQQIITGIAVVNLASAAQKGSCLIFSEVTNAYSYDSSIPTNFINAVTVSSAGSVGSPYIAIRSVGLASKAFSVQGTVYFLSAYQSSFQPTYFLVNGSTSSASSPVVVGKLAYENGGGYLSLGLPSVTVNTGNVAQVPYLYKDLVQSLNTLNNSQQTTVGGIYSQTGINLVTFTIGTRNIDSAEIGKTLNLSGGFGWMYDGYLPVEQNFFLWPDSIECVWGTTGGAIHAQPDALTNTAAYFYQVTYEWTDNQGNTHRSAPSIPVAVTTTGSGTTGSITVKVPTLRLTYKTANPAKIVIYRWSVANQTYYQVTSISSAQLNSTTSDSISFVDVLADSSVVGNSIIYTTGGVVEDVNPPAYNITTLFDTRQWVVDAEDPNLLWVSKAVIEGTPVEWSDLFTIFVAPSQGAQGSTGPITALAPMDDKLIIFKANAIYYLNGSGPNNLGTTQDGCSLGGYSQPIFITSVVGCANQQSIVFTSNGLMFQSNKGIWLLGRDLSTSYIGAAVEQFNSGTVQSAVNVPETNQVRFTLSTGQSLMYDYYYGQWGTFAGVPAISSCIFQNLHTYINSSGAVYQETPGKYLDGSNPVLISFTSGWLNLAGLQGYERLYDFNILGTYISPHFLVVQISYDYNPAPTQQSIISPNNYTGNYGSDQHYGQTTPYGGIGSLEQWQIHTQRQTCQSFQISVSEIFNPAFGTIPGAGFTMSGLACRLGLKKGVRPIRAANSVG